MLNEEDNGYFKKALVEQKNSLIKEAGKTVEEGLNVTAEDMADTIDRSSAETDRNFTLRLRERERGLLKKIDEALERLEDGSFGVCQECGGQIAIKRLKARPMATLCIKCKEDQEREEKLAGK